MKKIKKSNKWQFWIFILIVLSLIFFGFWNSRKDKNELKKHSKETVATIIGIEEQNRRGFLIKYEFQVKGKKYTEFQKLTINKELIKIGDKFKIVYSDKNPKNSVLDFNNRITE